MNETRRLWILAAVGAILWSFAAGWIASPDKPPACKSGALGGIRADATGVTVRPTEAWYPKGCAIYTGGSR